MLPYLKVSGTHYEIGYQIGSRMKENIQEYIASSAYMQNLMIPFYSTREGVLLFEKTERILREKLPQYISEVEGIANGSELPYKTIMMLNINCPSGSKGVLDKGCTTLILPNCNIAGKSKILGHTEDGPPEADQKMFLVEVDIPATGTTQAENFVGLSYPGSLVGRALGFNINEGFAWSMNAVTPKHHIAGIPRQFLLRTLAGQGLSAFLNCIHQVSNGFSVNIADKITAINIEVAPKKKHVTKLNDKALVHCNKFQSLSVKEVYDIHYESSMARHARIQGEESKNSMIDEAGKITTEMDVKFWLGDEEGDLKVYRTRNTKRDVLLTLATGIFNLENGYFHLYTDNPRTGVPKYEIKIEPKNCLSKVFSSL